MWTRAELKQRAKVNLKRYFLAAFIVSLIFELLSGNLGGRIGSGNPGTDADTNILQEYHVQMSEGMNGFMESIPESGDYLFDSLESAISSVNPVVWGVIAGAVIVGLVIGIAFDIFVISAMEVGKNRFYMESRGNGTSAGISRLFWGFNRNYLNIVWTMFLKNFFVTIGTFCCVVPGIYLAYCYYMVPYILAENPDMKASDVLRLSKDMMEGEKLNTIVLELSFVGWWILGSLLFGIGRIFVQPYYDATLAELYAVLRQKFSYTLNGFGYPDYGPYNGYYGGPYNGAGQYENGGYAPYGEAGYAGENAGWQQPGAGGDTMQGDNGNVQADPQADRTVNVRRSEGGPGRGYYLNGEFHPYTEDELNEMGQK